MERQEKERERGKKKMSTSIANPPATKPRNKLRKAPKRARIVSSSAPLSPRLSLDTARSASGSSERRSPVPGLSPPDLSDTKWEDFVRQSGYLLPMTKSPRLEQIDNVMSSTTTWPPPPAACAEQQQPEQQQQQQLVPEFAHLAVTSAAGGGDLRPPSRNPRRQSLNGSTRAPPMRSPSSSSTSTTASSDSAASKRLRRYSKTPVLRIGQLEDLQQQQRSAAPPPLEEQQQVVVAADNDEPKTPPTPPVPRRSARRSSAADKMAEQYHSLLHSPTCARLRMEYEADVEKQGAVPAESAQTDISATRQDSIEAIRSAIARRSPVQHRRRMLVAPPLAPSSLEDVGDEPPEGSPTSDGTLVGFEEDAIYFKPAFTPEGALTPIPEDECYITPLGSPQAETKTRGHDGNHDDNLSLQICVTLLVNELKSVMERRDSGYEGIGPDEEHLTTTSPLQIWLMIEAYDRLRDQMLAKDTGLSPREAKSLEAMFDTWMKALYRVHEKVAVENGYTA